MTDTLLKEPDGLERTNCDYSNLTHEMPEGADALLRQGKHWMPHYAWNYFGYIWFADGQFHERIMVYRRHVETMSADTLYDLISNVNDKYGSA
jgi:hypothetical protein